MQTGSRLVCLIIGLVLSICLSPSSNSAFAATATTPAVGTVVNSYAAVTGIAGTSISVDSTSGFSPGDSAVLIQMKGATVDRSDSASHGDITGYGTAGRFEFVEVASVGTGSVTLVAAPTVSFQISGKVQLVKAAVYSNSTISSTIVAAPWDGNKGGVIVIEDSGALTLTGVLDATGLGFRGGALSTEIPYDACASDQTNYTGATQNGTGNKGEGITIDSASHAARRGHNANGGGGGNITDAGGGGGGNLGAGGVGGREIDLCDNDGHYGGLGGQGLDYSPLNRVFMGGGGGSGSEVSQTAAGGPRTGGGIVIVRASQFNGSGGTIRVNGLTANDDDVNGADGGGAAGSVAISVNNGIAGMPLIESLGGDGGSEFNTEYAHGTGGGGGGGAIVLNGALCTDVNWGASGGAAGLSTLGVALGDPTWGAVDGENGACFGNFTAVPPLAVGGIEGTVFLDSDGSNTLNATESRIGSITLTLYDDSGTATDTSDDALIGTTVSAGDGSYQFNDLDPGTYLVYVDINDPDLPSGTRIGTDNPETSITVTVGTTQRADFGFDLFNCVPGGGTPDALINGYFSTEIDKTGVSSRNEASRMDNGWRSAMGLPQTGTVIPWLGYVGGSLSNNESALFSTRGVDVDVALVNIAKTAPCEGDVHGSGSPKLVLGSTLQADSPRPSVLYNTAGQPAYWNETSGKNDSPNAVRFTFSTPVKGFGAWFGDLETRTDGFGQSAYLRLLDSAGNRLGNDISIMPLTLFDGATTNFVDQNECGSSASDLACGNTTTRWVGFIDDAASARVKQALVIVGDDDFADLAGSERISFIGADIVSLDFGDAPVSGTAPGGTGTNAYGAASHVIDSGLYLGATVPDTELANQPTALANGDDVAGSNDEDGISAFPILTGGDSSYVIPASNISASGTGTLHAWIDFDGNGVFDTAEHSSVSLASGALSGPLQWSGQTTMSAGTTFVRFRLTSDADITANTPVGMAEDGEVEDYTLPVKARGVKLSGRVYIDINSNALSESTESGIGGTVVVLHDVAANRCYSQKTQGDGSYAFSSVRDGSYALYQAHGEGTPVPQDCGVAFVKNPPAYRSTSTDTLAVTVNGSAITDQDFGEVRRPVFEPDNQSEILPGNVVFYRHTFTSLADGAVSFSSSADGNAVNGWAHILYDDENCDGVLNGTEANVPIGAAGISVNPQDKVCLINKVLAPNNVPAQDRYRTMISATFSYLGDTLSPEVLSVTDLTIASDNKPGAGGAGSESGLELRKTVQNITQGGSETASVNQAKPGDTMKYRIYYRNKGTGPITDLEVNDVVPAFTGLVSGSASCDNTPPSMTCTPQVSSNALSWEFTGSLAAGAQGSVSYAIKLDN